ncbi:aldehyde dehydrogenase (NADP(+)) [Pimelobacter sp. 30-1]|uniref:aldehyde dehydrogenase (NADP(+)) n=1 Tax=Pimelobacter sp. 30-1 TaxID=2004991 RepID=UPI001C04EE7F|nr:aldehyde dehydrogenase (NADP(+)) [Pimelobacter sp. 30-1]MBU2694451.1 aldehyde dehydrogenase (NADP(+)) [Pimelobacter sp. 30-1]
MSTGSAESTESAVSLVPDTRPEEVDDVVRAAARSATVWSASPRSVRAALLEAVADALGSAREALLPLAHRETRLPVDRLGAELDRTTFQLRLLAAAVRDGGYLGVRVDPADDQWLAGAPRPDLRRTRVPLGPVVVFPASNFPFAFGVAGGDTASALAAGCPVIVKAHPGHPGLSAALGEVVRAALASCAAPDSLFQVVFGRQAGVDALAHPLVRAGAFTGSIAGGRALLDVANGRSEPIPFFGELGSVNPVFVTARADADRGAELAAGLVGSFTLSAGQLCTKPGVVLAPAGGRLVEAVRRSPLPPAAPMLNDLVEAGYLARLAELRSAPGVRVLAGDGSPTASQPGPVVLTVPSSALRHSAGVLLEECFGPSTLVVEYADQQELLPLATGLAGQLTAGVFADEDDPTAGDLVGALTAKAGRILWNQWPTGVAVTHAQQHGGPYPASTAAGTTSVGTAAIERFTRPVTYQGLPDGLLPPELRAASSVPRHLDGSYVTARS